MCTAGGRQQDFGAVFSAEYGDFAHQPARDGTCQDLGDGVEVEIQPKVFNLSVRLALIVAFRNKISAKISNEYDGTGLDEEDGTAAQRTLEVWSFASYSSSNG